MTDPKLLGAILQLQGEVPAINTFEEAWAQWRRTVGMVKDRYAGPAKALDETGVERILVIPDLHIPFHEPEMVARMLAEVGPVHRAICIGDFGDSYALSRFLKYESMPYSEEWAQVTLMMQSLSEQLPSLEIVIGNHDARLEKQLRNQLTQDMVDAVKFMTGGTLCPITALTKQYPNITVAKHTTPAGHEIDWFTTVGDAWLGHPEKYSRVPGSALRSVEEWLSDNEEVLGLEKYRLVVMGHTHTMLWLPWRADRLLVECGCLCRQQGYMTAPKIGGRPQRRGYLTFEQRDGVTDFNSVRLRWFS